MPLSTHECTGIRVVRSWCMQQHGLYSTGDCVAGDINALPGHMKCAFASQRHVSPSGTFPGFALEKPLWRLLGLVCGTAGLYQNGRPEIAHWRMHLKPSCAAGSWCHLESTSRDLYLFVTLARCSTNGPLFWS